MAKSVPCVADATYFYVLPPPFHYHGVLAVVMKNCDPLVSSPALAMDRQNSLCFSRKFSSSKRSP